MTSIFYARIPMENMVLASSLTKMFALRIQLLYFVKSWWLDGLGVLELVMGGCYSFLASYFAYNILRILIILSVFFRSVVASFASLSFMCGTKHRAVWGVIIIHRSCLSAAAGAVCCLQTLLLGLASLFRGAPDGYACLALIRFERIIMKSFVCNRAHALGSLRAVRSPQLLLIYGRRADRN